MGLFCARLARDSSRGIRGRLRRRAACAELRLSASVGRRKLAKTGQVKGGSQVLAIGSVDFDRGVGGGELGRIINQPDDETSGPGTAALSACADSGPFVRNVSRFDGVFLLGETGLKILPRAGLPWNFIRGVREAGSIGVGVANMDSYAHGIAAAAVVQLGLLGAVASPVFSRNFYRFRERR